MLERANLESAAALLSEERALNLKLSVVKVKKIILECVYPVLLPHKQIHPSFFVRQCHIITGGSYLVEGSQPNKRPKG